MRNVYEKIGQNIPRPIVKTVRDIGLFGLDVRDRLLRKTDALTPPRSLHFIGGGDSKTIGKKFFEHFQTQCGLTPDQSVLDIGCGTGRMAVPLLSYMDKNGSYIGFDISKKAIMWCQRRITSINPKFTFYFADIRNAEYNPKGNVSVSEFRFPCEDESVDFAFATSVFTHMFPLDIKHYLKELRRILKPHGQAMLTFFLLDEAVISLMAEHRSALKFTVDLGDCRTIDKKTPERAIAVPIQSVMNLLLETELCLLKPVMFGSWSGRKSMLNGQDVIVVGRRNAVDI